ncbi:hypothetical protein SUGI_0557700 [Cryptomeria japonica]|nr:hypothetical protein SUGI_0557700 [Cryptomeria japonica]
MHDHLRDLGRDIANKQPPCRLWFPQQIIDIQKQVKKRSGIHGIITTSNQVMTRFEDFEELPAMIRKDKEVEEFRFSCSHGKLMVSTNGGIRSLKPSLSGLKYLVISGDFLNQEMGDISRELVWLRWFQIGRRDLPSGLPLKKLRVLELYEERYEERYEEDVHHLEELWGKSDDEAPVQLRQLLISHCLKFQGFPNSIGHLIHLKKIVIIYGHNVTSLPDEFCLLQSLEHLVLYNCRRLSSLPYNFGNLRNLRHLNLSGCAKLRRLPVTFKNLRLLEHLNLRSCEDLTFASEDLNFLENIARLEFLNLGWCKKLEELPRHITNQVSLRELNFSDTKIRELPDNIGQLTRLTKMRMNGVLLTSLPKSLGDLSSLTNLEISAGDELECLPDSLGDLSSLTNLEISAGHNLECLPDSLGDLSSLTNLKISSCSKLECLPDSLGDLSSLTNLEISDCPKLECLPVSIRQLSNLQELFIYECPISECNYGAASLPFGWSNLKKISLKETEVCRISFSEACCPHLERLDVGWNHQLKEIEALPMTLKSIYLENCEMLKNIPNFAGFTSLKEFHLEGCYGIEKIEGLENCTRLEELIVDTCWEVPGIESLEHMQDLKRLILKANNISVIEHCIQRIQKWPDERIIICARAVPDAVSLLHSSLSPNLVILHSISNIAIDSMQELVLKGDAIMFCFVINCVSSQMTLYTALDGHSLSFNGHVRKGRWLLVGVITQHNSNGGLHIGTSDPCYGEGEVEKGLVVRGEEQTVREAVRSLLPLFSL